MSSKTKEETMWLLQIRGEKQGPFSTQEIVEKLMRKELKVIHRVSETGDGWVAICNEPIFENHIKSLIDNVTNYVTDDEIEKKEDEEDATIVADNFDEISGIHNLSALDLGIKEQLSHAKQLQQATANISLLRQLLAEVRMKRKVIIVAESKNDEDEDELHPDDRDQYIIRNRSLKELLATGTFKMLVALAVVSFLVSVGLRFKESYDERAELEEAQAFKEKQLKKQYGNKLIDQDISSLDGKGLMSLAKELIGKSRPTSSNLLEMAKASRGDHEIFTTKKPENATRHKEVFRALNVKAYEELLRGHLDVAEKQLLKSLELYSPDKTSSLLLLMETALLYKSAEPSAATSEIRLKEVLNLISKYRSLKNKDRSKLIIGEIALAQALGNTQSAMQKANEFLLSHPRGEQEETTVGYEYKTSWSGLLPHCIRLYNADRTNPRVSAFLSGCLVRTMQSEKAEPYIYYAYKKSPDDQLIKDLLGWVYFATAKFDNAKKILWDPTVPSFKVTKFQTLTRLEFCKTQDKDPICSGRSTASGK